MGMIKYTSLKKPSKGDKLDPNWGRAVVDAINSITPISGKNIRMNRTIHGNVIESTAYSGASPSVDGGGEYFPVPCKIVGGNAINGYDVIVYENGVLLPETGTGTLFTMQFNTNTTIPTGTIVQGYTTKAFIIGGTEQSGD